jgi:hypothetical protein
MVEMAVSASSLVSNITKPKPRDSSVIVRTKLAERIHTSVRVGHDLGLDNLATLAEDLLKLTVVDRTGETRNVKVVAGVDRDVHVVVVAGALDQAGQTRNNLPTTTTSGGLTTTVAGSRGAATVAAGGTLTLAVLTRLAVLARLTVLTTRRRGLAVAGLARVAVGSGGGRVLPDWACQALYHGEGVKEKVTKAEG